MKRDDISLRGTEAWAYDVPVTVEPGRILFNASWVRANGGNTFLPAHIYEIQKSTELRLVTADIIETAEGLRISCIEETAEAPFVEGPRRKIVGQVCVAVIPAGDDSPSELRVVSAPGAVPSWPIPDHEPLQVVRPDLESAAIERSKLHVEHRRGVALVEAMRRTPVDVTMGLSDADRDRLLVALGRSHGIVTGDLPKEPPVSHR